MPWRKRTEDPTAAGFLEAKVEMRSLTNELERAIERLEKAIDRFESNGNGH